ncbi:MAG: hypothetical protein GQE15_31440 [Archangiaceae bacterium]|nr:hypothetical protein [Archangiaceae bacterium]
MRLLVLAGTLASLNVFAQQAPPCTKELTGVLYDFGTPQAPRLFKCDGRTWAVWPVPASLCTTTPAPVTEPAPPAPAPADAPPPMPPLETLPPLPKGPAPGTDVVANGECRRQCMVSFNQCVKTRCGTAIAASCRQSCDKQQTKCVTGCP